MSWSYIREPSNWGTWNHTVRNGGKNILGRRLVQARAPWGRELDCAQVKLGAGDLGLRPEPRGRK